LNLLKRLSYIQVAKLSAGGLRVWCYKNKAYYGHGRFSKMVDAAVVISKVCPNGNLIDQIEDIIYEAVP
jgi:hypothetical protein